VTGDPDTRHFSELLRKVYENPEKERARIKEEANKTAQKFSWKSASDMILDLPIPKQSKKIYNKHKILYIIPYKMAGGGEMWIRETIKKLDRNIYEPHIVFVNGISPELEDMFKDLNIIIENLEFSGKDHALKCLIESEGYSIIHFYNSLGVYNVLRSAWQQGLKCRIVETVHSDLLWPDSMVKVGKRDDLVMSIISVSKSLAQKLTKMGNKHITVFPQPINWERFKPVRNKEILKQYNIPDKFVVGFVGRMSPEKNIPAILSCAKHMPEVSFVMVGDGPQKDILSKVSSKNVYFIGRQNEVEKFYSAFDILILPSIMEGMPLVILEAMATGTPAVASNVGAIHEIIENNGLLINKPTDINGFINAIEFFKNINNWTPYSNNCLIKVEEIKTQNININNFYKNLLTGDLLNGNTSTLMEG
jgi:glycosyltransferase involved in cell wall biosynthesis